MSILMSVIVAVVLVFSLGQMAPMLPGNELLGGTFYQVISIVLAVFISMLLNMPMLYMFNANSNYRKGNIKKALELYEKAYKTKRLSPDMEIYCGYILLKEGKKEKAADIFKKLEDKKLTDRQRNSLNTNKSILLWKMGQINEAVELLETVWEKEESVTVAGTLGALMLIKARETGDYSKAVEFCEKTNEQFTYEKTIMANLGEAYYCTNQNERALETFAELMDCGSLAPAPYYYYALALIKAGKNSEAEEMLNRALRQRFSALSTVSKKTVRAKLEELVSE